MKDQLDSKSREALIKYRLDKANQALKEADFLASSDFFDAAINRLYFAVYYAACALMLRDDVEAYTHNDIKRMLSLKFILKGELDRDYGKIYQILFNCYQTVEYEDFTYYDKESFEELQPLAKKFINEVSRLV